MKKTLAATAALLAICSFAFAAPPPGTFNNSQRIHVSPSQRMNTPIHNRVRGPYVFHAQRLSPRQASISPCVGPSLPRKSLRSAFPAAAPLLPAVAASAAVPPLPLRLQLCMVGTSHSLLQLSLWRLLWALLRPSGYTHRYTVIRTGLSSERAVFLIEYYVFH